MEYWALVSMVVLFFLIQWFKESESKQVKDFSIGDWICLIGFSVISPIGVIILCSEVMYPWLVKERHFRNVDS